MDGKLQSLVLEFARRRLIPYVISQWGGYKPSWHHYAIADALERVERGECKRLMIWAPPRHGKTMLVSESFPPWYLGRNPNKYVIQATYSGDLSEEIGRKVRNQMRDPLYRAVFPGAVMSEDSSAASRFTTSEAGAYYAVGVGGPLTGRGADVLLIDDPVKGRKEAESETYQRAAWEWYRSVAYTRLMPNASIVLIMTRWSENDLAGRILRETAHEGWEIINLEAIRDGRALWPEAYPLEVLERIKQTIGMREWNALFMQNPVPDEGSFFKEEMFRRYAEPPKNCHVYGMSDYAVTDDGGDFTEHGVWGVDPQSNLWALDWWSGQTGPDVWVDTQLDLIAKHKPLAWCGESGVIRRAIEPFLKKRMQERNIYVAMHWLPSIADKPTRARAFQARASAGKVYIPTGAWGDELVAQLLRFPNGVYDDKVDVCSLMGRFVDHAIAGVNPEAKRPPVDRWAKAFGDDDNVESWKTA